MLFGLMDLSLTNTGEKGVKPPFPPGRRPNQRVLRVAPNHTESYHSYMVPPNIVLLSLPLVEIRFDLA